MAPGEIRTRNVKVTSPILSLDDLDLQRRMNLEVVKVGSNLLECFEVYMQSKFGLEFVWKKTKGVDVATSTVDSTSAPHGTVSTQHTFIQWHSVVRQT